MMKVLFPGVLIVGLAATAATSPILAQGQATVPPKTLATVNGEAITQVEFDAALKRMPAVPANWPEARLKALHREVLAMIVDDVLLKQYLRKNVPAPDRPTIEKRWAELHNSLRTQGRGIPEYCKEMGQTEQQLVEEISAREQLRMWDAQLKQKAGEEQIRAYYEANKEMFEGVIVRASHIALRAPGDADAQARQALVQKLQGVRAEIVRGLSFDEAARKHSQDPSASHGGDLGFFPPRPHDPDPFVRTASRLKQGELSDVVQTEYGYHLIFITERKPGKPTTFAEIKDTVRDIYVDEQKANVVQELRKSAKVQLNLP
jgi:peptidyl-prolyl cis-trans isomerase C